MSDPTGPIPGPNDPDSAYPERLVDRVRALEEGGSGASGVGDSSFYDDTQGMVLLDENDDPLPTIPIAGVSVELQWADGLEQITGTDLALLDGNNKRISILTAGVYAIQLRAFVRIDTTADAMSGVVTHNLAHGSGAAGDLDTIAPSNNVPFYLPMGVGAQTLRLAAEWTLWLPVSQLRLLVGATLFAGSGDVTLTSNGATEVLVRRVV